MTITTENALLSAFANNVEQMLIDKASLSNAVAAQIFSLWRATGTPAQGVIPTTSAVPTKATTGAFNFTNQTDPATTYLGWLMLTPSLGATGWEFLDRIAHMGGLVLNSTASQTTNLPCDLNTLAPSAARVGPSDYSEIEWSLDVYTAGGATASNATINVTYNDASSGNLDVVAVGGTLRASRSIPLTPFIPTGDQGKFIRGINSVILSASTGTAGNFGFTARRMRTGFTADAAGKPIRLNWADLGLPSIPNDSCIEIRTVCSTTTTGTLRGSVKFPHG